MKILSYLKNINFILICIPIVLGFILRTKLLILNPSYWLDTCSLGVNLYGNYLDLFKPLEGLQVAPPLFLVVSKFVLGLFPNALNNIEQKDIILRFFPYLFSVLTLPVFPILVQKMFNNKYFTLFSTLFLCFNVSAVNYAIEFKQYSCELFFFILLILLFYTVDLNAISKKQLRLYSAVIVLSPWFAFSSWLVIFLGLVYLRQEYKQSEDIFKINLQKLISISRINFIVFLLIFFVPIYSSHYESMNTFWNNMQPSFFTINNFIFLFPAKLSNLVFNTKSIWGLILLAIGCFVLIKSKNRKNIYYVFSPIVLVVIASFIKIWPFENRLILFLLPLFIILYLQIILLFKQTKIVGFIAFVSFVLVLGNYAKKEPEDFILNNTTDKKLFYILKENNPLLENVISGSKVFSYYSNNAKYMDDNVFAGIEKSLIPELVKNNHQKTYWIYTPYYTNELYLKEIKNFLETNEKINIIEIYEINSLDTNRIIKFEVL